MGRNPKERLSNLLIENNPLLPRDPPGRLSRERKRTREVQKVKSCRKGPSEKGNKMTTHHLEKLKQERWGPKVSVEGGTRNVRACTKNTASGT